MGARLAAAGLSAPEGTPGRTLGEVVGGLDPRPLTEELGDRWEIAGGYFKRHSSCSYTHPAVDAVLALREELGVTADEVAGVVVDTHRLSMPLARVASDSRLSAMFSLPFVVALALRFGAVAPELFTAECRTDDATLQLARRVEVRHDPGLDERLPGERANRVTLQLTDGRRHSLEQPNPVGDADYHPLDARQVAAKLTALLGQDAADRVAAVVEALPEADDARAALARLP
jgi:2-methylcitrate dehydratase PrpD